LDLIGALLDTPDDVFYGAKLRDYTTLRVLGFLVAASYPAAAILIA